MASAPDHNLVIYTPKPDQEAALLDLVRQHGPAIRSAGLAADEPFRIFRATDVRKGTVSIVETFAWRDRDAADIAHQTPEVMAVWEPMGPVLEDMTIFKIEPLEATATGEAGD